LDKIVLASKNAGVGGAGPQNMTLKVAPAPSTPSKLYVLRLFKLVGLPVAAAGVGVGLAQEDNHSQSQRQPLTGRIPLSESTPGLPSLIPVPPVPVRSPSLEVQNGITNLISDIEESFKESRMSVHIEETLETKEVLPVTLMKHECHEEKSPVEQPSNTQPTERENKLVLSSIQEKECHPVILKQDEMNPEIITTENISVKENNQMFSKESEVCVMQAQIQAHESKPKGESNSLLRPDIGMLHGGKRDGPQDIGVALMVAVTGSVQRAGVQAVAGLRSDVDRLLYFLDPK